MKNYYELLEVSENASPEIIEKAYKVLSKKYHPDTNSSKGDFADYKIKKIIEAYEVLSNKEKRIQYDLQLKYLSNKRNDELKVTKKKIRNKYLNGNYFSTIKKLVIDEFHKPKQEQSKDLKALIFTIIIIGTLLFIALKIPVIKNFLFP